MVWHFVLHPVLARSGRGQGRLGLANVAEVKNFPYILCQELWLNAGRKREAILYPMFVHEGLYRVNFLLSQLFPSYFIFTPCPILRCVNQKKERWENKKKLDKRKLLFLYQLSSYPSRMLYVGISSFGKATHTADRQSIFVHSLVYIPVYTGLFWFRKMWRNSWLAENRLASKKGRTLFHTVGT
jgi:hypothetical protein